MDFFVKRLYITGYRSFELGVFQEEDAKIVIIKKVIRNHILSFIDQGVEWILLSGNLGVEYWAFEVIEELKREYDELKVAIIYPFLNFGEKWNEKNLVKKRHVEEHADFVEYTSHKEYENPQQLKNHTQFLLTHTECALIIYEEEYEGKSKYFYQDVKKYQEKNSYTLDQVTLDDLQNSLD